MKNEKETTYNEESVGTSVQSEDETVAVSTENNEAEKVNETVTEATDKSEVETVAEPKTVTASGIVEKSIENTSASYSLSKCSKCGTELTSEQIFCPNCGHKNDILIENDVADAIQKFNEGIDKKAKKKKGKTKVLIISLSVIAALVVLVVASFFYFNSKVENIIKKIESGNVSKTVIDDYNALTPVGQAFFRDKIIDTFVKRVSDNPYSNTILQGVVNKELLDEYSEYKNFADTINITDKDGTNVVEYIDEVLELNQYKKYNDVQRCVLNSISSYEKCLDYVNDAGDFSTYSFMKLYIGYAHSAASDAVSEAKEYSTSDTLCTQYVGALETLEEELSDLYYGTGYYSSSDVSTALKTLNDILTDLTDAESSVETIVSNLPEIK